ncbi:MAG: S9 family peptidase, partial [Hyphomonadaceae bacterium]
MFRPSAWFAGALAALAACTTGPMPKPHAETSDPFLWLEEVEGAKALEWVRAQNARSLALLEADPRYTAAEAQALAILNSKDRLALGTIRNGYVYNFWQDEAHVRGLWRRMPLAAYRRGAPSEGGWETLLDIDALAAAEKANWVFQGVDCLGEDDRFCLVRLSDGGKDAHVQREFDVSKKAFTPGGFALPEAKSDATWADKDTLLVATDWGPDTLTESGYPFIVKRLRRGDPLSAAQEILRGDRTDVSAAPGVLEAPDGTRIPIAVVADTFFTSTNYRLDRNAPEKIDLPPRATLRALYKDQLIFTIEEDWRSFASGALLSMPAGETARAQAVQVIYAPGPREAIEGVDDAAGALLVSATRNVLGRLLAYDFDGARWTHKEIALPAGTVSYVAASAHARTAFAVSEAAITPESLFEIDAPGATAQPVRSLPALFCAE